MDSEKETSLLSNLKETLPRKKYKKKLICTKGLHDLSKPNALTQRNRCNQCRYNYTSLTKENKKLYDASEKRKEYRRIHQNTNTYKDIRKRYRLSEKGIQAYYRNNYTRLKKQLRERITTKVLKIEELERELECLKRPKLSLNEPS